ncbi:hypothetical protein MKW92_002580 [Papaver armeniacum]|nr:hypothetical protein MKW92_002580 [Papaver armeniacum]
MANNPFNLISSSSTSSLGLFYIILAVFHSQKYVHLVNGKTVDNYCANQCSGKTILGYGTAPDKYGCGTSFWDNIFCTGNPQPICGCDEYCTNTYPGSVVSVECCYTIIQSTISEIAVNQCYCCGAN